MSEEEIRRTIISSFASIFGPLLADSLIIRSFPECQGIEHKNDCIRTALESALNNTELFVMKLETIIRLHSNALEKNDSLIKQINRVLEQVGIQFDPKQQFMTTDILGSVLLSNKEKYLTIDGKFISDAFYKDLINQINTTFYTKCYTATMVLIRKLFENLLIDILRKKYGINEGSQYFWDDRWKQFQTFSKLIKIFESKLDNFEKHSTKLNDDFIKFLKSNIQFPGNESAHTIETQISKQDFENKKTNINYYINLLVSVLNKM